MIDINFDELDDKTKLIVSKMEKVIENKNSEIQSKNKRESEEQKNFNVTSLENEMNEMKKLLNTVVNNTKREGQEDELLTILKRLDIDLEYYNDLKKRIGNGDIIEELKKIVSEDIKISTDTLKGKVVLVGPTGVGKTTTIAKLAGRLSLVDKKKVGLITVDTYRIGAVEQLKTYAEIMNIPFKVVITMKEMSEAVKSMEDCDIVLIDTTGRSSKNSMQISELRAFIEKAEPDYISLVISSITKNRDIKILIIMI